MWSGRYLTCWSEDDEEEDQPAPILDNINNKCTPCKDGGTGVAYLTARLNRDRPDLMERVATGEFKSVRAAAIEAGIVEPSFQCPADPMKASRRLLRHFSGDSLLTLLGEMANHAGYDLVPKE